MKLELYYAEKHLVFDDPANEGFEEALELLSHLKGKGISVKTIDTSKLSKEELCGFTSEKLTDFPFGNTLG